MVYEGKKTLLLVEDEALIAMSEKSQLEKYGYSVITAATGEKAVEMAKADPTLSLILMDIDLGKGIDGTLAAELILKDHDIPILFVSSHSEREIVEKTEKITSYGYVLKNSSITVLDASIKMAFKLFDAKVKEHIREAALHENEEKYRLLHETAGTGIGYYSIEGIVLSYNQLAARHMNGVPEDFIGKSIYDIFPKGDAETYHQRIKATAFSDKAIVYEDMIKLPSGNMFFLSTFTRIIDVKGRLLGIQIISQDITKQKQLEDTFRKSEERYSYIFNTLSEGVALNEIVINENGEMIDYRILYANTAFYEVADFNKEIKVIGALASDLYGMDETTMKEFWESHKSCTETQHRNYLSPINSIMFRVSTSPFFNGLFVTSFINISEKQNNPMAC